MLYESGKDFGFSHFAYIITAERNDYYEVFDGIYDNYISPVITGCAAAIAAGTPGLAPVAAVLGLASAILTYITYEVTLETVTIYYRTAEFLGLEDRNGILIYHHKFEDNAYSSSARDGASYLGSTVYEWESLYFDYYENI